MKLASGDGSSENRPMTSMAATFAPAAGRAGEREERVLYVRAAGFHRRFLAATIDVLIVLFVTASLTTIAALALGVPLPSSKELGPDLLVAGILDRNPMAMGAAGLLFGVGGLYQFYFGGITGQTVGKRLLRLRVISCRGTTPGPFRGILRFAAMFASVLPAGLGWIWCLFDRERRALHDHLSATYVIVEE
jgi:uncharacterized RDD family membrane protein YckC